MSLLVSCAGWDTKQLMAFAVISYLHLPLHSHLDLSQTEHFYSRHETLTLSSLITAMMKHSFSTSLLRFLLHFAYKSWTPVNLDEPWSFILKKHRQHEAPGYRYLCERSFLSSVPCGVTACREKTDKWITWLMSCHTMTWFGLIQVLKLTKNESAKCEQHHEVTCKPMIICVTGLLWAS